MTAPHEPTDKTRAEVKALGSMGNRHEDIARYIGIDKKTLYKYYRKELDAGLIATNQRVAQALFKQATEQNSTTAAIFWLKCHAGWKDRTPEDDEGGATPVSVTIQVQDARKNAD